MASSLKPSEVADLIAQGLLVINDGYRAKNNELANHGLPFARGGNINGGFHFEGVDRFPLENLGRVGEKVSRPGDVVFTSKGTVGRFAFVKQDTPRFVYSPQLCFWRSLDPSIIDHRWLYYWMHSPEFFVQYNGVKAQTDMADYVSLRDQRRMRITLPSIAKQRKIAEALGTLDDKADVSRRMNRTLEAAAKALFRSWFVDFEPIKAKAAGATGYPGMPAGVFDRLPDQFAMTETGPVPLGWRIVPIGDLVTIVGGSTPSTNNPEFWDGGVNPFCTPKDMSRLASPILLGTERHITDAGVGRISSGRLPVGAVILSSRAPIGYLALTEAQVSINQGIIAMLPQDVPNTYVLLWTQANMPEVESRAGGSTFAEISKRNFRSIPALLPDDLTLKVFGDVTKPMFDLIAANERERGNLTAIRDSLLPKLMSDQIDASSIPEPGDDR